MDHHVLHALDGLEGLLDDVGPGLGEDLDGYVVGDQALLDDGPQEVVLGLRGGGEAHLDLLEAQLQQELVKLDLLLQAHGGDKGLVAVPQVHAAPVGGLGQPLLLHPVVGGLGGEIVSGALLVKILHSTVIPFDSDGGTKKTSVSFH